jgi:hypothetical protein
LPKLAGHLCLCMNIFHFVILSSAAFGRSEGSVRVRIPKLILSQGGQRGSASMIVQKKRVAGRRVNTFVADQHQGATPTA